MPEEQYQDSGAQYYILPDDPLRALNILREAAGLNPLPPGGDNSEPS
jgi:hypothetical protein